MANSLINCFFIDSKSTKDSLIYGKIISMVKEDYWYIVRFNGRSDCKIKNLPQMTDWLIFIEKYDFDKFMENLDSNYGVQEKKSLTRTK